MRRAQMRFLLIEEMILSGTTELHLLDQPKFNWNVNVQLNVLHTIDSWFYPLIKYEANQEDGFRHIRVVCLIDNGT